MLEIAKYKSSITAEGSHLKFIVPSNFVKLIQKLKFIQTIIFQHVHLADELNLL